MSRRIFGIETEYGVTCTFQGQRRLSPDEVARYLFRRVVSWGRSSNVFLRKGEAGTTMKAFVRMQLVKIVMLLTMIVVGFDILSFAMSMKDKRKTTIQSTIETVLIGLKPSFLQGDSVQANNFLFSLKKGRFIGCFKLDFGSLASNDCEINEAPIAKYESVEVPIEYDGNKYGRVELYFDFG